MTTADSKPPEGQDQAGEPLACILFSYNRAMQLDLTLRSLMTRMVNPVTYTVIYHHAESHRGSYEQLISEWSAHGVRFLLRGDRLRGFREVFPYLLRLDNLYCYLRLPFMRRRVDNFKELVEQAIADAGAEFTFFSTDDQYLLAPTYVPQAALRIIAQNPRDYCYRFFTGDHFADEWRLPGKMKIARHHYEEKGRSGDFFEWDCRDPHATLLWKYRFNVDDSVFHTQTLRHFLRGLFYHMPTTLEGCGFVSSRWRGYFSRGLSSCERTGVGIQANNVQTFVDNPAANFSPELLRKFYEAGYRLCLKDEEIDQTKFLYIPQTLYFYHHAEPGNILDYMQLQTFLN